MKTIVKKTTDFEYTIARAELNPAEYIDYIKYFINVDKLFNVRFQKFMATHDNFIPRIDHNRCKNLQKTLIKHVNYIFERSTRRFPQDQSLWESHISFLTEKNSTNLLDLLFGKILSLFPTNANFWIQASTHELHANNNMHAARVIMQRALRANENNTTLWKHFFDLELYNALKIKERRNILGITSISEDDAKDSTSESNICKPLVVIFKHCCQSYQLVESAELSQSTRSDLAEFDSNISFHTSELWTLMQMLLGYANFASVLPDDCLSNLKDVLNSWKMSIESLDLIQFIFKVHHLLLDMFESVSAAISLAENNKSTNLHCHEFEPFGLILNFITLLWKELNVVLKSTDEAYAVRPFFMNLVGRISTVVLKLITASFSNFPMNIDNAIGEVSNIYQSIFLDYSCGILRHCKLEIDQDEGAIVQKLAVNYKLTAELKLLCDEVETSFTYFCGVATYLSLETLFRQYRDGAVIELHHKILSILCVSSIVDALKETQRHLFDGCDGVLLDWVDTAVQYFENVAFVQKSKLRELVQFTETLSGIFVADKNSIIINSLIDKLAPFMHALARSPSSTHFIDEYFIPHLNKLSMQTQICGQSKLDSFFRSFLAVGGGNGTSINKENISNKNRSRYFLKYLRLKLELLGQVESTVIDVGINQLEELYNWASSYTQKYGIFLVFLDQVRKSTKRKFCEADNAYCFQLEIAHMFWHSVKQIENYNVSLLKSTITLKRRILEEIFIRENGDSMKCNVSSHSGFYSDMMEDLAGIYRSEGNYERGNIILCKMRRL